MMKNTYGFIKSSGVASFRIEILRRKFEEHLLIAGVVYEKN